MNRFVSNFILGFFVLTLMAVYGFAKQPTVYSLMTHQTQPTTTVTTQGGGVRRVVLPNGATIVAQVVDTPEAQREGLAGTKQLASDSGMLFVFAQPGTHPMWMKGMKIPIDMVWLDDQGRVVYLAANVPVPQDDQPDLPSYVNDQPAKYVLELTAGEAEQTGIREGVQLTLS